mgnify:CR=1 FL=1
MIVCPTSLVYNWKQEFDKFAPSIKYEVLSNGKDKRHELINNTKANVYITTYGLVREDLELYKDKNLLFNKLEELNKKRYRADIFFKHCRISSYTTYSNLLFIHMHARLSYK